MSIRKVKDGYRVLSERTKRNMGTYPQKAQAERRLKQIEAFKAIKKKGGKRA
jgi:hypothetical protein